jgi:nitrate reductase delta subunit
MLVPARKGPVHRQAVKRLRQWTRERFNLGDASVVMAAQIACVVPGCPPIETVVAFWTKEGTRYRFKVFKPIADVVYDDLPYAWLLPSLVDDGGLGLECC